MNLVKESIKFTRGGDPKENLGIGDYHITAKRMFPGYKIAYYLADTDEFEYKEKKRIYTLNPNIVSFLYSKDYLVYVENNKAYGYIKAKNMSSWISIKGSVFVRKELYTKF